MPSGAGATSRAWSTAPSSSSASRRACGSSWRNKRGQSLLEGTKRGQSHLAEGWQHVFVTPLPNVTVPFLSPLKVTVPFYFIRSCARPSRKATTAQAAATPAPTSAIPESPADQVATIASCALATTKSLVRYTSVSLTFFALYFDSRSTLV